MVASRTIRRRCRHRKVKDMQRLLRCHKLTPSARARMRRWLDHAWEVGPSQGFDFWRIRGGFGVTIEASEPQRTHHDAARFVMGAIGETFEYELVD